jgi:hemerythrin
MTNYISYHFIREETVMVVAGYPDIEEHKKAHKALLIQIDEFLDQVKSGLSAEQKNNILNSLHNWLMEDISITDSNIRNYSKGKEQLIQVALDKLKTDY